MTVMNDLRQAILDVLQDATPAQSEYDAADDDDNMVVSLERLKVLQAEYNIHFVEPDEQQVDLV